MIEVEKIKDPHNKIFVKSFSRKETAIGFVEGYYPQEIVEIMDLDTLEVVPSTYIDDEFKQYESDLVYKVKIKGKETFLYVLFEHQSTVDFSMLFRLLRYMVKLWEAILRGREKKPTDLGGKKKKPTSEAFEKLPPILPIVLSQGKNDWNVSLEFIDLIDLTPETKDVLSPYIPKFKHLLVDLSGLNNEDMYGTIFGKVVLNVMKAAMKGKIPGIFDEVATLLKELYKQEDALGLLEVILRYALETSKEEVTPETIKEIFSRILNQEAGDLVMTLGDKLRKEGEIKGEAKRQIKTLSKLLKMKFKDKAEEWLPRLFQLPLESLEKVEDRIILENINNLEGIFKGLESKA